MKFQEKLINYISLLIPLMTILMLVVITSRYIFGIGRTDLQELIMYLHGFIFLSSIGYVFLKDEHVRVDIFYRESNKKSKNKINSFFNFLFLIPLIFIVAFNSLDFIELSWRIKEISTEAGGLKTVYLQKSLILLLPISLIIYLFEYLRNP